jgi:hypothetical protein
VRSLHCGIRFAFSVEPFSMRTRRHANQPASANPAITTLSEAEHHWRAVAEPVRYASR